MVDKIDGKTPEQDFDDDSPEWTDALFARARPAHEILPADVAGVLVRPRGRPTVPDRKRQLTLRLSPDVITALRATGPGWMARAEAMLRAGLACNKSE
ncbi:MAG: hypothetical protein C0522_14235 [Rhodocyclaceae bacterium]|nr:hypothetical protein [Rhodocyclaceae bacterium]